MPRTRTRHALIAAGVMAVSVSAGALAASDAASAGPIPTDTAEGRTWQLQQQLADGELMAVPDGVVVTLLMEGGTVSGSGGCNTYTGTYTLDGASLTFGPLASTMMACEEPAMSVESAYVSNLAATTSWFSDGGSLTFQNVYTAPILVFAPAPEPDAIPTDGIEGITWLLSAYLVGGDAMASVPGGVVSTLLLQGGHAGGNGGCNSFTADYTLDGTSLTFGPITQTLMLCEGPGGEVETVYFANLELVASWSSDGGSLTLADAAGSPLLVFGPAPTASIEGGWAATAINNGHGGVETTDITGQVTAVFGPDGSLSGSDGCNQYSTAYTLDADRISISSDFATTRMACPSEEHDAQASAYIAALVSATTWSVDPVGGLELRDDSGALQVSYAAAAG